jgi:hypothetical protein
MSTVIIYNCFTFYMFDIVLVYIQYVSPGLVQQSMPYFGSLDT